MSAVPRLDGYPDTLEEVQRYLISAGFVRDPETSNSTLPPLWVAPDEGTPAPGEGAAPELHTDAVAGIFRAPGIAPRPYEGFIRIDAVDFVIRVLDVKDAVNFEASVRVLMNDKRGWWMGRMLVESSQLARDLQQIDASTVATTFNFQYTISTWGPFQPAP